MRFYVIEDPHGQIIGCELKLATAHATAAAHGFAKGEYSLSTVDAQVCADTVRRLLGNLGGYAQRYELLPTP